MNEPLIDQIHECAFVPETWPKVLDQLALVAGGRGGAIFAARRVVGVLRWSASAAISDDMATYVGERWPFQDTRRDRIFAGLHSGFVTEQDLFSAAELEADRAYQGFYRPRGLGRTAFTSVALPTDDLVIISVERDFARGPMDHAGVAWLDTLRPHLARSALLAARLNLERARAITEALALIGLPALVFDPYGKVLAANHAIEALTGHIRWRPRDCIALTDRAADALLQQAIAAIAIDAGAPPRSFAVRDAAANAALVAHIIPVRGDARDIFARCAGVLLLTPVAAPQAPPVELVRSLFDLTPAEARVARSLAAGDTLDEIASSGSVSRNTVRTHVRGLLEKTGCRRQAEVVALLSGITVPAA